MCSEAGNRLRMVSVSQVGNLDGIETPIREITKIAKDYDALVCVDGAQSAPHMPVDVQSMGIDFFAFSSICSGIRFCDTSVYDARFVLIFKNTSRAS